MTKLLLFILIAAILSAGAYVYVTGDDNISSILPQSINARVDDALVRAFTAQNQNGDIALEKPRAIVVKGEDADALTIVSVSGKDGVRRYLARFEYDHTTQEAREAERIPLIDEAVVTDVATEITSPSTYEVLVSVAENGEDRILHFARKDGALALIAITFGTLEEHDVVLVSPLPYTEVPHSFAVQGAARGPWYFEASFPVELRTLDGESLAIAIAQAEGDSVPAGRQGMTENLVPFSTVMVAPSTFSGPAVLILKKDNPSGLPEHDDSFEVLVDIK